MTLVRDSGHALPSDETIDVYEFSGDEASHNQDREVTFASILSEAGVTVNASMFNPTNELSSPDSRPTVVCTANAAANPGQVDAVHSLIESGVDPVVVATRSPYDLSAFPDVGTYLATYGDTRPALTAAAAVLVGREPTGRLPVTIPDKEI